MCAVQIDEEHIISYISIFHSNENSFAVWEAVSTTHIKLAADDFSLCDTLSGLASVALN